MSRRLRALDWILAIGLLLLLAGAPSYFAVSDAQKALESHDAISIRGLHVGDRAEFAFYIESPEGTVRTPVAVTFEVVEGGSGAPKGGAYILRWTQRPLDVEVGGLSYAPRGATSEIHLDAEGSPIWYGFTRADPARAAQLPGELSIQNVRHWGFRALQGPTILDAAPERILYRPDVVERLVGRLETGLAASATDPGSAPSTDLERAFVAAESTQGHLLLGMSPRSFSADAPPIGAIDGFPYYGNLPNVTLDHPLPTTTMMQRGTLPWAESFAWTWYVPELGTTAGFHQEWRDGSGEPLLTIDLLPVHIRHGKDPVPRAAVADDLPSPGPHLTRLGDIERSGTLLHQNLSLADIHDALSGPEAPAETRRFIEGGGYIIEYSFQRDAPLLRGFASDKFPGLVPGVSTDDIVHATWRVTLANEQGDVLPVRVAVREVLLAKEHHFTITAGCTEDGASAFDRPDCSAREPWATSPDRAVVAPEGVLLQVRAAHELHGHEHNQRSFHYLPLFQVTSTGDIADPIYRYPLTWQGHGVAGLGWHAAPPTSGVALERQDKVQGRIFIDIGDGGIAYSQQVEQIETEPEPEVAPAVLVATSSAFEPISGLELRLIWSGLLLVGLSVVLRVFPWPWTIAGLKLAGAFFTRITPGKALAHPARADIFDLLRNDPGLTPKAIQDRLGLGWGTTVHHLRVLESSGHLTSMAEGRSRHFFPKVGTDEATMRRMIARQKPVYAEFLHAVEERPGIRLDDLTEVVGRHRAGISRTGSRLAALGLVAKSREGRHVTYHPAQRTR